MISASRETSNLNSSLINQTLDDEANKLVKWSNNVFGDRLVMTTSFGIQSAVMLHLVTRLIPNIPIIWVDTGYCPQETYQFAEKLTQRLNLNLKVYQSDISTARMEALHGKLWEKDDLEALNLYDYIRKVEPMQRALNDLKAKAWLAGLRSSQTTHRQTLSRIEKHRDVYKIHPILHWHSRNIYQYLTIHNLPYHPYFDLGYVTVGDWHSSRPLTANDNHERDTRFNGVKQECGLHLQTNSSAEAINIAESQDIYNLNDEDSESQELCVQDLDFLNLTAQWSLKELESRKDNADNLIKIELLTKIIKQLKIAIDSIKITGESTTEGLTQVTTTEEKEYFEIINSSTKNLLLLIDDIINLGLSDDNNMQKTASSVKLESLYEKIINSLN